MRYEQSFWEWDRFFRDIDYLIVGGGIVGLSAAIHLRERAPKARILLLDRGPLPLGASTRNAGFACFGSMTELRADLSNTPAHEVWALVEQRFRGLRDLRQRLGDAAIGYQPSGGFEVFAEAEAGAYESCLAELEHFNRQLKPITGLTDTFRPANEGLARLGFGGLRYRLENRAEGLLDTGRMMCRLLALAREADIRWLGGIRVESWEDAGQSVVVATDQGWEIEAGRLLIATNGLAGQLLPNWPVRPARNQVLITQPLAGELAWQGGYHYQEGYLYFRPVGRRVLLGGGRHWDLEGETTTELEANARIREGLTDLLRTTILAGREVRIERWWTGIMGVADRKTPLVRAVSPRVGAAVRLGGMGVAIGHRVGLAGAQLLLGEKHEL